MAYIICGYKGIFSLISAFTVCLCDKRKCHFLAQCRVTKVPSYLFCSVAILFLYISLNLTKF